MSLYCLLYKVRDLGNTWHYNYTAEPDSKLADLQLGCQDGDKDFLLNNLLEHDTITRDVGTTVYRPQDISKCREWVNTHLTGWSQSNWLKVLDLMEEDPTVYLAISW